MATRIEILKAWNAACNADPASLATASYLEEDFQNAGRDGRILMNKRAYLDMSRTLATALSGLKFEFTDLQAQGESILARFHFEGTHTSPLDLTAIGLGVIPPTGRRVVSPEGLALFTFRGDKIAGIQELSGGIDAFAESLAVRTRPL